MTELWRQVPSYEGVYEVSSLGRVRSVDRVVVYPNGSRRPFPGKVIQSYPNDKGYPQVKLCHGGRTRTRRVHQLVAAAFLGPVPAGQEVRHKNGVRADCRAVNLEYGTHKQNVEDRVRHGTAGRLRCSRGHRFTEANTYINGAGHRECRQCRRTLQRARRGAG